MPIVNVVTYVYMQSLQAGFTVNENARLIQSEGSMHSVKHLNFS